MDTVSLIGIDLGKHSFHLHGQDRQGRALLRKKCNRKQLIELLANFNTAQWLWKPVPAPITWRVN